jgi:hypothetical protein
MMNRKELSLIIIAIGFWLIATAVTYNFQDDVFYNDIWSAGILIGLGFLSFLKPSSLYFIPFFLLGMWLHVSPLVFWYPTSGTYLNDTLIGSIVTILAFLFLEKKSTSQNIIPEGWTYAPSSWTHRVPIIFLAMTCWFLARYLDTYQLGYIFTVWDPFFGDGTAKVLTSKVSKAFPLPDAGLGAFAYFLEALLAWQGGVDRWKSKPWVVLSFGVLAIPVGITSIILILLQPLVVESWCFICLLIACLMILIVLLSVKEVIATLQCIKKEHKKKHSIWKFIIFGKE